MFELYHVTFSVHIINTSALCINKKCLQPHHIECTSSRLITEVKQYWAELVLGWVTAWEYSICINPNKITNCVLFYASKALKDQSFSCVDRGLSLVHQKHVEYFIQHH